MYDLMTKAKCIVDYLHFTKTYRGVSKNQHVPKSTIQRWVKKDGLCSKVLRSRKTRKMSQSKAELTKFIDQEIKANPFITMDDLAAKLFSERGIKLSGRTIQRNASAMDYTYKKAVSLVDHNHDNTQVRNFCTRFETAYNNNSLYSVDEAGFYVGDHPRKGRSKRGQRLAISSSKQLRKTKFSFVMVVGPNGIAAFEIIDHNYKNADFVRFFTNLNIPRGSTFVMDNLRSHHNREVQAVLTSKEITTLFTPPYSPRCNPIEKVFGMLKPMYRRKCPSISTTNKADYKQLFLELLNKYTNTSFASTFENTLAFLKETVEKIDNDPNFKFIGYDITSFIKLNQE